MIPNSLVIAGACVGGLLLGAGLGYGVQWLRARYTIARRVAEPPKLPPEVQEALKAQTLTVAEWHKWNPWYSDPVLALEAQSVHLALQKTNPGQPLEENLADVTAEMRRRYPEIMTIN